MKNNFNIAGFSVSRGVSYLYNNFLAVGVNTEHGLKVRLKKTNNDARLRKFPFIRALLFVILATKNAIIAYFLSKKMVQTKVRFNCYEKCVLVMRYLIYVLAILASGFLGHLILVTLPNFLTFLIFKSLDFVVVKALYYNLLNSFITSILFILVTFLLGRLGKKYFYFQNAVNKAMSAYRKQKSLDIAVVSNEKPKYFFNPYAIIFISVFISIYILPLFYESNLLLNLIYRIVLFAIILSAVYEVFVFLNQYDNRFVKIIGAPSLWVQSLFYSQSNEESVMCAIVTLKEVLMMSEKENLNLEHNLLFEWQKIREKFLANNITEESDVDWIFCEVLQCNRAELKTIKNISTKDILRVRDFAEQRIGGEPLQRIFGHSNFYGFEFELNDDTLIPRFDTEILVETVLKDIKTIPKKLRVLDLCTGSGCIAITISKMTDCEVVGIDINENALSMANLNADRLNAKVLFLQSDLFSKIKTQKFDIIVSNPPYIKTDEIETLDVSNFDPHLALDGGQDGLDFYRKIIAEAPNVLNKNGRIYFELGKGQFDDVKKMMQENFCNIKCRLDYQGIERVIYAELKND